MKNTNIIFRLFIFLSFSCSENPLKDNPVHYDDWTKVNLPENWVIEVPKYHKYGTIQGVDSEPGYMYLTKDSIVLQFDSGSELILHEKCDFPTQIKGAKDTFTLPILYERTGLKHELYVDTIGERIAKIIVPTILSKGTTSISITDCPTGAWLSISGNNLTESQQKQVLEMFSTIRMINDF